LRCIKQHELGACGNHRAYPPKVLVRRKDRESGPIKPSNTQPTAPLLKNVAVNLRCSPFAVLVDTTIALYFAFGYGTLSAAGLCWGPLRSKHCFITAIARSLSTRLSCAEAAARNYGTVNAYKFSPAVCLHGDATEPAVVRSNSLARLSAFRTVRTTIGAARPRTVISFRCRSSRGSPTCG
jgi:hypothetical protein